MRILIGCEFSGIVREAFRLRGHNAYSCDLLDALDGSNYHIKGSVIDILEDNWDLAIFHPPCTYLSCSGLHWNSRILGRSDKSEEALVFVEKLLSSSIPRIALENPVGLINSKIRKPDQIIQPYHFGDNASKKTCLWLKNLPLLTPTKFIPGREVKGKFRWNNQTDSGQNNLTPSDNRSQLRSITYQGIAEAMSKQWS